MFGFLEQCLTSLRPAFSRTAAFRWFVIACVGFITRADSLGASSIVRALWLEPQFYPSLLHFFHADSWSIESLLTRWWQWIAREESVFRLGGRIVLLGDHTKIPKEGRRMPAITTLHQNSETSSKPSFFRGHHWGCVALLITAGKRFFAMPLRAEIHRDAADDSRATRIVRIAQQAACLMGYSAYLVLDAFFSVGPVFRTAKESDSLHILTRAKKNVVAYSSLPKHEKAKRGRPRIYGKKVKLFSLFDRWAHRFEKTEMLVYQKREMIRSLALTLVWRPVRSPLRFFLIESSRGRIILMSSDLTMNVSTAITLYSRRISIETLFSALKNLLGGLSYHFWSKYLRPSSRRTSKKNPAQQFSSRPDKTRTTHTAIEKYVTVQLIVLGVLQLLSCKFGIEIGKTSLLWLRTPCGEIPSEFVTKTTLSNIIHQNLFSFAKDSITQIILSKQKPVDLPSEIARYSHKVA